AIPRAISNAAVLIPDLTSLISLILGVVVAVLLPLLGVLGPVGWLVGLAVVGGAEYVLRANEWPTWARTELVSANRLIKIRAELVPKLTATLFAQLGNDFDELKSSLSTQIRAEVRTQIDKELSLIR